MISADDQIVRAIVASYERMPERLSRSSQSHGQRQQRQEYSPWIIITFSEELVSTHTRVMIDVAWLGHPYYRVKQQHTVNVGDCSLSHFFMRSMQRISCLKSHDVWPSKALQSVSNFGRSQTQVFEIVVSRRVQHAQPTAQIEFAPTLHFSYQWMLWIAGAE